MPTYNRSMTDVVNEVAHTTGITKAAAKQAVDATITALANAGSDPLVIRGFGTFRRVERAERVLNFNGQTIPAYTTLTFKASKNMRDSL